MHKSNIHYICNEKDDSSFITFYTDKFKIPFKTIVFNETSTVKNNSNPGTFLEVNFPMNKKKYVLYK